MAHISIFVGSVNGGAERLSDEVATTIEQAGHTAIVITEASLDDIKKCIAYFNCYLHNRAR
ncbi:hypothetical protein P20652_2189 [Pseudoalteromonas sp. BSi20652]|nr:hypothetical protein P20652_2189 [Pseudoalteromonas sp. BSi20652]